MKYPYHITLICMLWPLAGWFASTAHADDTQLWSAIAMTSPASNGQSGKSGQAGSKLMLWFDGHARFSDDVGRLGTSIIRPGMGYRLSDQLTLWLGYARVTSHPGDNIDEDRIWQQATYPLGAVLGGSLSGRTRLEQRFRDADNDTGVRLRQFLRWSRPIGESDYSVVLWDEVFVGLNDAEWGQRDGFDQNRAFAGLAWRPNSRLRAEIGYLHNSINRPGSDQTNHTLSITLFVRP